MTGYNEQATKICSLGVAQLASRTARKCQKLHFTLRTVVVKEEICIRDQNSFLCPGLDVFITALKLHILTLESNSGGHESNLRKLLSAAPLFTTIHNRTWIQIFDLKDFTAMCFSCSSPTRICASFQSRTGIFLSVKPKL